MRNLQHITTNIFTFILQIIFLESLFIPSKEDIVGLCLLLINFS